MSYLLPRITLLSILCLTVSFAQAADRPPHGLTPLQPRVEAGLKAGSERTIGVTEAWIPVAQNRDRVLYTDLRYSFDNDNNDESNMGVGYRAMDGDDHIVGGHAWIDRRVTERGSIFYQMTLGAEFMKENWDLKANTYIPLSDAKTYTTPNVGHANPYLVGSGIYVDTNGTIIEEPQSGVDAEIGYRLPIFESHLDSVRVYGGGYAFHGDNTPPVAGGRVRTSVDVNPWLNVGARFQHDAERGSQSFLEATLRFPIAAKQRFQDKGLRARMDESPERDVDIVTGSHVDNGLFKPVINNASGVQQRVLYVDNTNVQAGTGTKENPFNNLAAVQSILQDNDIVYINHGDGTTNRQDQGLFVAKNNVSVIGSGSDFIFDNNKFSAARGSYSGTVLQAATTAPVISLTTPVNFWDAGVTVTGDHVMVSGITVQNSKNGVTFVSGSPSQVITQGLISNVTVNVTAAGTDRGLYTLVYGDGRIDNMTIENSTVNQNNLGFYGLVTNVIGGHIGNLTYNNNTVNQSLLYGTGISVDVAGSRIDNLTFTNNNVNRTNYGQANMWLNVTDGATVDKVTMTGNNISQGTGIGVEWHATGVGAAINNATIGDNTFNSNAYGLYLNATGNSNLSAKLEHNTVTGNAGNGVYLDDDSTGIYTVDMGGGTLSSTGRNRVYSNGGTEVFVDLDGGQLKAENNWWGSGSGLSGGEQTLDSGSTIDATPFLATDPGI